MFDFLLLIASMVLVAYVWIIFILDYLKTHPKLRKFETWLVLLPPLIIILGLVFTWKINL